MWKRIGRAIAAIAVSQAPLVVPAIAEAIPERLSLLLIPTLMGAMKGVRNKYNSEDKTPPWWAGIF